jgi:hypothetical protein
MRRLLLQRQTSDKENAATAADKEMTLRDLNNSSHDSDKDNVLTVNLGLENKEEIREKDFVVLHQLCVTTPEGNKASTERVRNELAIQQELILLDGTTTTSTATLTNITTNSSTT